jgi:thiamine biosynthesis lipoprotein
VDFGLARPVVHQTRRSPRRGAACGAANDGWHSRDEAIMGTAIRVELWCEDARAAQAAMAAVMDEMHRIDRAMSPHKPDSELAHQPRRRAARPCR